MKHYTRTSTPQEPIALGDALTFLRAAGGPEDTATVASLISVAREFTEMFTGRALCSGTFLLVCDGWAEKAGWTASLGDTITLDRSPLASVQSVKYYADGETSLTTLTAGTDYIVITGTTPGRVQFLIDPPALAERPDAVQIEFTAGVTSPANVPPTLIHAVRLLVAHFYELRTPVNVGNIVNDIPFGLRHLLESQRVSGWCA